MEKYIANGTGFEVEPQDLELFLEHMNMKVV